MFVAMNAYIEKEERSQINKVILHLKNLKKNKLNAELAEGRK